jgi:serine/threonine-protein kinase
VYDSEHVESGQRFALKIMLPEHASNRERLRRFQNEAKAAGHLEHPNIATVIDTGNTPDGSPYLVMEYLTGQDCGQLLAVNGPLSVVRACDILRQACIGLFAAHQAGIVHRDIKPENLFVTQASDGTDLVKILDFGIAKLRVPGANVAAVAAVARGTVYYMAPEQICDAGKVDGRADIWALGVVLYELLTGRRPFAGSDTADIMHQISFEPPEPFSELQVDIPAELISAIDLALEKDPEKRFETVMALADAIAPFTGRPALRASRYSISQRPPLLTPVDAAYSITHPGVPVPSNAPNSKSVMTTRQRAYRIYTLLLMAALIGFAGGGLMRRVVSSSPGPQADASDLAAAQAEDAAPAPALQVAAEDVGLSAANTVSDASTNAASATAGSAVPLASVNTRLQQLHKLSSSVDAGTLPTVAERSTNLPHLGASLPTKTVEAGAPKVNAQPPAPSERVPNLQKSNEPAPSPSDTTNPQ